MSLVIYIVIMWFVLGLMIVDKKVIGNREIIFVFMLVSTVNTHSYLLVSETFNLVNISHELSRYNSYILHRSFLNPILVSYCLNRIFIKDTGKGQIIPLLLSLGILMVLEALNLKLEIISYKTWNFFFTICYLFGLLILSYGSLRLFKKIGWT
ncbi:hypothetical protein IM538_20740 [Cytobacillus suaedae]|nr:hypothetical protein IM538_20740 [Cytobacillus suaedae]